MGILCINSKETNDEIKTKRYTFSTGSNVDVEESCFFFLCRAKKIP